MTGDALYVAASFLLQSKYYIMGTLGKLYSISVLGSLQGYAADADAHCN